MPSGAMPTKNTHTKAVNALALKLGIDFACALDVVYLRSKKRWTIQLEKELIELHKSGKPPDMATFGTKPGVYDRLLDYHKPMFTRHNDLINNNNIIKR